MPLPTGSCTVPRVEVAPRGHGDPGTEAGCRRLGGRRRAGSLTAVRLQTLRKKGFNGCDSPEPDGEDSLEQSPLLEDRCRRASEELDGLFRRYGVSLTLCPPAPGAAQEAQGV